MGYEQPMVGKICGKDEFSAWSAKRRSDGLLILRADRGSTAWSGGKWSQDFYYKM